MKIYTFTLFIICSMHQISCSHNPQTNKQTNPITLALQATKKEIDNATHPLHIQAILTDITEDTQTNSYCINQELYNYNLAKYELAAKMHAYKKLDQLRDL